MAKNLPESLPNNLLGAFLGFVLVGWLATAQEKTLQPADPKAATSKTSDAKSGDSKARDAKAGDSKADSTKEAAKLNEKTEAFEKMRDELRTTVVRLEAIQKEYREVKPEGRAALENEFKDKKEKAKKLLPQLTEAAKAALAVEPANNKVMDHLGALAYQAYEKRSAYEEAFELARLVLDQQTTWEKFRRPELFRIAGVSAFYSAQFDAAEKYLKELENHPDESRARVPEPDRLKEERAHWQEELARRKAEEKAPADPQALPRVKLATTQGDIVVELFENEAPNTVANFITLVEKKFYDGKLLESTPSDVGAGLPNLDDQDVNYKIACECAREGFRRHFRGSLAMSIPGGKDTGCSQFRIWLEPMRNADPKLTAQKDAHRWDDRLRAGRFRNGRALQGAAIPPEHLEIAAARSDQRSHGAEQTQRQQV